MRLKSIALAAVVGCLGLSAAIAQEEPQVRRQSQMKAVGGALGALGGIAKGQKPYEAETVKAALTTISTTMKVFPDQFPAGSEAGSETEAAPAVWQNPKDFHAKAEKLAAEADKLLAAVPADQAGVGAAMNALGGTCSDCHQTYRVKK
ncbi:cytochrome c [Neorhizobium sp. S3-V5DH]|uniref:c-type cytochrome n=1 Tax=Neorhizobium sp. S3-V5DH TaxID=2485166 RepID=UPI000DD4FA4B|nr:cytochrome c [Neorhizobium sp. S3-V5DH]TCV71400.1 cytochrome c556 [Neorhizobium sp. S3-V5DH]